MYDSLFLVCNNNKYYRLILKDQPDEAECLRWSLENIQEYKDALSDLIGGVGIKYIYYSQSSELPFNKYVNNIEL